MKTASLVGLVQQNLDGVCAMTDTKDIGVAWRCGVMDDRPVMVNAFILVLKMGRRKTVATSSKGAQWCVAGPIFRHEPCKCALCGKEESSNHIFLNFFLARFNSWRAAFIICWGFSGTLTPFAQFWLVYTLFL